MTDAQAPVLDRTVLDELLASVEGDRSFVAQLVETYVGDGATQLDQIDAAVASGDPEALIRPAHTLKSSSATVGAARLADLAGTLEQHARDGRSGDPASADALRAAWTEATAALQAWLEQAAA